MLTPRQTPAAAARSCRAPEECAAARRPPALRPAPHPDPASGPAHGFAPSRRSFGAGLIAALAGVATGPAALRAAPVAEGALRPPRTIDELPVFREARLRMALRAPLALLQAGDAVGAALRMRETARLEPGLWDVQILSARMLAHAGATEFALEALRRAAANGLWETAPFDDPVFAALAGDDEFIALRASVGQAERPEPMPAPPAAVPGVITAGVLRVEAANSAWDRSADALVTLVAPQDGADQPRGRPRDRIAAPNLPGSGRLDRLALEGAAAGNAGDFYENRDNGHSTLDPALLPGLTHVAFDAEASRLGLDRGVKGDHLFGGPTIGNSSTAVTKGPRWRSMARLALTTPGGAACLHRQYRRNQLFVYPEHKDHDPFYGDVFPAQTPYLLVAQGSSWSDRPMLIGLGMALAAFRPEVKALLIRRGLIAPTLQMLVRRCMEGIGSDEAYLSPRAHPAAFDAERLDFEAMVDAAQALKPGEVPPPATLRLISEMRPDQRIELFGDGYDERLFDTPHAIARVARGAYRDRVFRISTAATADPNGRPLKFHWRVLTGGARGVKIETLDEAGAEVRITIPWQEGLTAPADRELRCARLDVMVVADNGAHLGAPAFLSVLFPARTVARFDDRGPVTMVYDARSRLDDYQDPALFPLRRWTDDYRYDAQGRLLGWTRTGHDGGTERFTRHGARIETTDPQGRPLTARGMAYPSGPGPEGAQGPLQVRPTPLDLVLRYTYAGPDDMLGAAAPETPAGDASGGG